jgi:hypothetical protein
MQALDRNTKLMTGTTTHRFCGRGIWVGWFLLLGLGCDSDQGRQNPTQHAEPGEEAFISARYQIDPNVISAHPELSEFIQQGLNAVYQGDYAAYRQLVARNQRPESETRFKLVCESLESVRVDAVSQIELPDVPPPAYRVIAHFEFAPDSQAALRLKNRSIALLVIREGGAWRLLLAPSRLQPGRDVPVEEPAPAGSDPNQSAETIDYPWEQGVDD